jgi:hypothetical protein
MMKKVEFAEESSIACDARGHANKTSPRNGQAFTTTVAEFLLTPGIEAVLEILEWEFDPSGSMDEPVRIRVVVRTYELRGFDGEV